MFPPARGSTVVPHLPAHTRLIYGPFFPPARVVAHLPGEFGPLFVRRPSWAFETLISSTLVMVATLGRTDTWLQTRGRREESTRAEPHATVSTPGVARTREVRRPPGKTPHTPASYRNSRGTSHQRLWWTMRQPDGLVLGLCWDCMRRSDTGHVLTC